MDPQERLLLESLDSLLQSDAARTGIRPIVEQARQKLGQDRAAPMAWAPIPLPVYGRSLPEPIQSSWVFILRSRTATGAERHPNSHQRMVSYEGSGDLQTGGEGHWQSNLLISGVSAPLEQRWISVPPNVWHQAVVPDQDWVVVSFHTVPADDLVEERPHAGDVGRTHQRRYLTRSATGGAPQLRIRNATEADLPVIVDINESLGFEQRGHLKEIAVVQGRRRGLVIWALRIPPQAAG